MSSHNQRRQRRKLTPGAESLENKTVLSAGMGSTFAIDPGVVAKVRELTHGRGAEAVFDFAGFQSSLDVAKQLVGVGGEFHIVGLGMGGATVPVGFFATPYESPVVTSYWGYRDELIEVVELARRHQVRVHVERFGIDQAPEAYRRLHDGTLDGRAVIVMG